MGDGMNVGFESIHKMFSSLRNKVICLCWLLAGGRADWVTGLATGE